MFLQNSSSRLDGNKVLKSDVCRPQTTATHPLVLPANSDSKASCRQKPVNQRISESVLFTWSLSRHKYSGFALGLPCTKMLSDTASLFPRQQRRDILTPFEPQLHVSLCIFVSHIRMGSCSGVTGRSNLHEVCARFHSQQHPPHSACVSSKLHGSFIWYFFHRFCIFPYILADLQN